MKSLTRLILALVLGFSAARAAETAASDASIRELLKVTEARKLVEGIFPQVEAAMKASMQQALKGRALSAQEQKIADRMSAKMMVLMQAELSWEKLEPLYLGIYRRSFSQDEIEGIIAFYKTPAGVALIKKLPVVMQQTMGAMQEMMGPMMQKMQGAVEETVREIQAENGKKG